MVAFVGRPGMTAGGAGVTAWFPLGPHETYVPWYHASPLYMNRVNVSNIYDRNTAEVRNIYNQRTEASVYLTAGAGGHGYVNRPIATVAVSQASFAAGRPVERSMAHVTPQELGALPVLPHPLVTPQRSLVVSAPARAVPERVARPALASRADEGASATGQPAGAALPQTEQAPAMAVPAQTRSANPEQRPLFHEAVPPQPRPSFDEQQKAIESTDPGRPLGPQQMDNLRQNRPVGPSQQREMPHPAPAPRAVPPAQPRPGR
jgi:hypothetical protein